MQKLLLTCLLSTAAISAMAAGKTFTNGNQQLTVDTATGAVTITAGGDTVIAGNIPAWGMDDNRRRPAALAGVKVKSGKISDGHGDALRVTVAGRSNGERATVDYDLYPDFVMTRLTVDAPSEISLNHLAPVATRSAYRFADRKGNYIVSVPYDNDAWVRYTNTAFGDNAPMSYEVTAIYNADTRQGLVIGSVEHDIWKTGISTVTDSDASIASIEAFGGVSSELTRDVRPHGAVSGKTVRSPRIILIATDDWRDGMELFADQCAIFAPRVAPEGHRPFGWNSWGKLQTKITYDKAIEVSDFIHDNIQNRGFHDADSAVVIDLDAFWDFGFKEHQHKQFVDHCHANGQKAGIYWCPFTDWSGNPDGTLGEDPRYKMGDLYLRVNGEPVKFDGAPALDPTHPGTRARIKQQFEKFIDWGYEYVKIDFMAHGAYESDKHYDPSVTTGTQAFNQGMAYIDSINGGRLWINLSIAPLFPANYAHSRRISCDAWGATKDTEYALNALTYGWWLDHVYLYNDADHIVYEGNSDAENRSRVTSSAITGVYFLGDDMSKGGSDDTKERVIRNSGNRDINAMARNCKSFRPVEHGTGTSAADMFVNEDADYIYVAIFNFTDGTVSKTLPLRRIDLSEGRDYAATELWSHDPATLRSAIKTDIPPRDVKVFRIAKN